METQQVKIEGVIKPNSINRKRQEWGVVGCDFLLNNGVYVYCSRFIPNIRAYWKVRVVGYWDEEKDFIARSVRVIGKVKKPKEIRLLKGQLKLMEFLK